MSKKISFGKEINTFKASLKEGVSVRFKLYEGGIKGYLKVDSKIGNDLSAIHIHKNIENDGMGSPGPIIVWLATSDEWQNGVSQLTPLTQEPCCSNRNCNAVAPPKTPNISQLVGKTSYFSYPFTVTKQCHKSCKLNSSSFVKNWLVIHGKKFKTINDACQTSKFDPGLDIMNAIQITESSKKNK